MPRADLTNSTHYWSDRVTPGLSLLCADFKSMNFRPHSHDAYVIAVTESGGSVIRSRGEEFEVGGHLLMVFTPDEPHEGWLGGSSRWRYRSLYASKSATDLVAQSLNLDRPPRFINNGVANPELTRKFLRMHRELEAGTDSFLLRESFLEAFCMLFQSHGEIGSRASEDLNDKILLRRAIAIIEERYSEKLLLDDLGAGAGLTSFQLIALFKRGTGLTPHTYLVQVRLRAACRMLRRGTSIAETSVATGFFDQSAMTNQFKRYFAITPMQYWVAWR
jgi:AraC-like DNA-binding protein